MKISQVSLPEVYKESADFRFFLRWFELSLQRILYDTENLSDLYDAQRCPTNLLWMLADTMGFKYDNRLPVAFNRLVLLYFMSMIRNRGSKDGVTLAAEVNLAQFDIFKYGQEKEILYDRLEDTNIPVNAASVQPHVEEGYIDIVYFSTRVPTDACIEYVRPLGMYVFQMEGVRYDARTKISIDARLTNQTDIGISIGPTHVGHYSRKDYASMQKMWNESKHIIDQNDTRESVWYRNSKAQPKDDDIDPGMRALHSLQLCNNDHVVESLLQPIFSLGYNPQEPGQELTEEENTTVSGVKQINGVYVKDPKNYLYPPYRKNQPNWNLIYDRLLEETITKDVATIDVDRTKDNVNPRPAVNPVMGSLGDAISLNSENTKYMMRNEDGTTEEVDK